MPRWTRKAIECINEALKDGRAEVKATANFDPSIFPDGEMIALPPDELPLDISEKDFQKEVIAYAQYRGWLVFHARKAGGGKGGWRTPVAGDGKGFPDLVLVRRGVVFAELKSTKGRLKPDQKKWRDALKASLSIYRLWSPCDWQEIKEFLK